MTNSALKVKRSLLRFLFLPLSTLFACLACQDHPIPVTPPAIQTNMVSVLAGRVAQKTTDFPYPVIFKCQFTSLGLGAEDITEYGVLFVADYDGEGAPAASELVEDGVTGDRDVQKVVFEDAVVLNTNREQYIDIRAFYRGLHFRAYAKSATSGIVYGDMLEWTW